MTNTTVYGTGIVNSKTGRILDVELANSLEEAAEIVEEMNARMSEHQIGVHWKVISIRSVDNAAH